MSDSVVSDSDGQYRLWCQLMNGRTEEQKALAINTRGNVMERYITDTIYTHTVTEKAAEIELREKQLHSSIAYKTDSLQRFTYRFIPHPAYKPPKIFNPVTG